MEKKHEDGGKSNEYKDSGGNFRNARTARVSICCGLFTRGSVSSLCSSRALRIQVSNKEEILRVRVGHHEIVPRQKMKMSMHSRVIILRTGG